MVSFDHFSQLYRDEAKPRAAAMAVRGRMHVADHP
jgi:hypothetical protein